MIIDAVTPLVLEQGSSVTSKQLAEAAGLAEGTIFRAFGDKQTLLTAVFERYLDPEPMRKELRSIDPAESLEIKVRLIIEILRNRFGNIFRIRAAIEQHSQPHLVSQREHLNRIIAELLEPDLDRLLWSRAAVSHLVRMLALASAIPRLNEGYELSSDELASMVLYGIVGSPPEPHPSPQTPSSHSQISPSTLKEHHAA
nr:TetR/AcrR family transcriptional regulator [Lysinibacter cavernae]